MEWEWDPLGFGLLHIFPQKASTLFHLLLHYSYYQELEIIEDNLSISFILSTVCWALLSAIMTSANIPGLGWSTPVFQLGRGKTLSIPMTLHAAARIKVRGGFDMKGTRTGIILLKGGDQMNQYDTDCEALFR